MFNLTKTKQDSAAISSHAMYGRVTPHLQSVRPSREGGDLLNQEASNAFQPFHYWKPCLIERFSSRSDTAFLNFYRYLSCITRKCHTRKGIRALSVIDETTAAYLYLTFIMRRGTLPLRIEIRSICYPCAHGEHT